jgi:hypothetical protein
MTTPTQTVLDIRSLTALHSIGGVLPPDLIAAVLTGSDLPGLNPQNDYHLELGVTTREAANRAWAVLRGAWAAYQDALASRPPGDPSTGLTRERWLLVLLRELGFGRVPTTPARGLSADGRAWPVSHLAAGCVPAHLLGWNVDLDRRTPGLAGAAEKAPHAMVQQLLNSTSNYLWAILANGSTLRILRDSSALVGSAYVEFDLAAIFNGELFSDFVALYLLAHQSRFEPTDPDVGPTSCWLERWRGRAVEEGTRALGALRIGVYEAIQALGTGLVSHPANATLRDDLDSRAYLLADFHRGLLRLIYRILFCFVAEDRNLLLDPDANSEAKDRYHQWFSTARLRRVAIRRAGDNHDDHWQTLRLVLDALGNEEGCAPLGLVGLGGIFETGPSDLDAGLALSNRYLLAAIRHLAITRPNPTGPRRVVDYNHLGAEELGGIYEGLLEFTPHYDAATRTFRLEAAAGSERKKTGAYYTPTSLTETLLDSALDPLLDRAEREPDPEVALLSLTVCDPACGSGHFLVAAGRRIAARVATHRARGEEPTLADVHDAMHDVVSRCIYGVDVNPLAAELAKVSLWLEGMQAGRPLSLLDGHIKVGNALLGATPALLVSGIPDEAFAPIEGDDRKRAGEIKKRNKAERAGQGRLGEAATITVGTSDLAQRTAAIEALVPRDLADLHVAARRLRDLDSSPEARNARLVADAWCSAFVLPKTQETPVLTQGVLVAIDVGTASDRTVEAVEAVSARYRWFHWHIEFPTIFSISTTDVNRMTGWAGGFDCVIGNPPWERVKLQEQEWFATRMPTIAQAPNAAARKRLIDALADEHPEIYREFLADRRQAEGESHFLRNSGRYPLAGRGDINTYAVFAETDRSLLASTGRLGVILPTGIATDATTQHFFKDLVTSKALASLYDFENRDRIFESVDSRVKFCLLTLTGRRAPVDSARFAFFVHHPNDLRREGTVFELTPEEIELLNPNTGTCPIFRSRRDAEITLGIYRNHPILVRKGAPQENPWGLSFMTMFHMANDAGLFSTKQQLESDGWILRGNTFLRENQTMLPLYVGLMTTFYDHRAADVVRSPTAVQRQNQPSYLTDQEKNDPHRYAIPAYWVDNSEVAMRLGGRWNLEWLLAFSDITSATNERTMVPCLIPSVAAGHNLPLALPSQGSLISLQSALSSLVFDFVARQKVGGTHMTYFILEQLPVPRPETFAEACSWSPGVTLDSWLQTRVLELVYTAWDVEPFACALGDTGPPYSWDIERRANLRAELDGAFFHLYGVDRSHAEYILATFPIANRRDSELTKRVLDAYDRITNSIDSRQTFVSTLDPPPGKGSRHPERP